MVGGSARRRLVKENAIKPMSGHDQAPIRLAPVEPLRVDTSAGVLSALRQRPLTSSPRGTIVGLHGGGYTSRYFDERSAPNTSMLNTLASIGFDVIAIDRPGYGLSATWCPAGLSAPEQIPIVAEAIDTLYDRRAGVPLFIVGHSIGGMIGIGLAAQGPPEGLAALSVCGTGTLQDDGIRSALDWVLAQDDDPIQPPADARRHLMFGPSETVDPHILHADARLDVGTPRKEFVSAQQWADLFPLWGAEIEVPVQICSRRIRCALAGDIERDGTCAGLSVEGSTG
jgi:pimeloyl-ACP methyl ester carboxylesterase